MRHTSTLGMKTKYTLVCGVVVLGCAFALFAADQRTRDTGPRLVLLKAKGSAIAELKVLKGATLQMESQGPNSEMQHDKMTGQVIYKGGVTLMLKKAGESLVTVKADEIELVPNPK